MCCPLATIQSGSGRGSRRDDPTRNVSKVGLQHRIWNAEIHELSPWQLLVGMLPQRDDVRQHSVVFTSIGAVAYNPLVGDFETNKIDD